MTHVLPLLLYFLDSAYFVQLVLDFDISNGFPLRDLNRQGETILNFSRFVFLIVISFCKALVSNITGIC